MTPAERSSRAYTAARPKGACSSEVARLAARIETLEAEKAALEQYAALAAHELVVPLVMTESYAAIVSDRLEGEEHADSRQDLLALGRGAARARLLVESLLLEARSSGRPLARQPVDLDSVVREGLRLLEPEIATRGARVELAELPEALGDEALLSGLFINLVMNALKYSPRRDGTIRIHAEREADQWRFMVESEGPTIPREDRGRIFQEFQRARTERRERGTGLGLAICRRIVDRHGGTIGVTDANGSGNRFFFTLPVR